MIDLQNLTEEDRQQIAENIKNGCREGELTGEGWRGWWKLTFEKWNESEN
jgi:hypothetical protein